MDASCENFKHVLAIVEVCGYSLCGKYIPRELVAVTPIGRIHIMYKVDRQKYSELEISWMQEYANKVHGLQTSSRYGVKEKTVDSFSDDLMCIHNLVFDFGYPALVATSNLEVGKELSACGIPWVDMNIGKKKLPSSSFLCDMFGGAWFCSQHDTSITGLENSKYQCAERMADQVHKWIERQQNQDTFS
ncbi:hypothetical protein HDE_00461 [Halotydeus destructor]|nr:hypothetical protein HDE_00461 [Halotydeus destructor]